MPGIDLEGDAQQRLLEAMSKSPDFMGQQDQVFMPGGAPQGTPMREVRAQQGSRPVMPKPSPVAALKARIQREQDQQLKAKQLQAKQADDEAMQLLQKLEYWSTNAAPPSGPGFIIGGEYAGTQQPFIDPQTGLKARFQGWDTNSLTPEDRKRLQDFLIRQRGY